MESQPLYDSQAAGQRRQRHRFSRPAGENGKHYALKMGFDPFDLQSEINVLKSFQLQRNHEALKQSGIPSYLKDVDDYAIQGRTFPFM